MLDAGLVTKSSCLVFSVFDRIRARIQGGFVFDGICSICLTTRIYPCLLLTCYFLRMCACAYMCMPSLRVVTKAAGIALVKACYRVLDSSTSLDYTISFPKMEGGDGSARRAEKKRHEKNASRKNQPCQANSFCKPLPPSMSVSYQKASRGQKELSGKHVVGVCGAVVWYYARRRKVTNLFILLSPRSNPHPWSSSPFPRSPALSRLDFPVRRGH